MKSRHKLTDEFFNNTSSIKVTQNYISGYIFESGYVGSVATAYVNYNNLVSEGMCDSLAFDIASLRAALLTNNKFVHQGMLEVAEFNQITFFAPKQVGSKIGPGCEVESSRLRRQINKVSRIDTAPAVIHNMSLTHPDPEFRNFAGRCISNWVYKYQEIANTFREKWETISKSKYMSGYFYTPLTEEMAGSGYSADSLWALSMMIIAPHMELEEILSMYELVNIGAMSRGELEELVEAVTTMARDIKLWLKASTGFLPELRPLSIQDQRTKKVAPVHIPEVLHRQWTTILYLSMCLLKFSGQRKGMFKILFPIAYNIPIK